MSERPSIPALLEDLGTIVGGVHGAFMRYVGGLIRHYEQRNARVAERIDLERRTMQAAGMQAHHAARIAGHESKGSGAR